MTPQQRDLRRRYRQAMRALEELGICPVELADMQTAMSLPREAKDQGVSVSGYLDLLTDAAMEDPREDVSVRMEAIQEAAVKLGIIRETQP